MEAKKEQKTKTSKKPDCPTYGCKYYRGEQIEGLPLPGIPPKDILCVGQQFYLCPHHNPFQTSKSNFDNLFEGQLRTIYKNLEEGEISKLHNFGNQ